MRRVHRAQHVRLSGEDIEVADVAGQLELTDEELQAAIDVIEAARAAEIDRIEVERLNKLRALGIPVDE